jgi:hypothetical protein
MGRTSSSSVKAAAGGGGADQKKIDRNRRMRQFGLTYVRPSKVEKDLRRAQSKDGRVGRGAAEHLAAMLEHLFDKLLTRVIADAGEKHQVQLVHVARALADPDSGFHGIFPTRVAGIFLPPTKEQKPADDDDDDDKNRNKKKNKNKNKKDDGAASVAKAPKKEKTKRKA